MNGIYIKIVLLGDSGCGKTSIVKKLTNSELNTSSFGAVGANFSNYSLKIDHHNINIYIWDHSGNDKYIKLCKGYYRNANVIILVCDISKPEQKISLKKWYSNIIEELQQKKTLFFIVINKIDLKISESQMTDINKFALKIKAKVFEISATQDLGVAGLFTKIAETYIKLRSFNSNDSFYLQNRSHSLLLKKSNACCTSC